MIAYSAVILDNTEIPQFTKSSVRNHSNTTENNVDSDKDIPDYIFKFLTPGARRHDSFCPSNFSNEHILPRPVKKRCLQFQYVASPWETFWNAHIHEIADYGGSNVSSGWGKGLGWECGCSILRNSTALIEHWLDIWSDRSTGSSNISWSPKVFSFFEIIDTFFIPSKLLKQIPIEPLVGFLRHPHHFCFRDAIFEKEYMLNTHFNEISPAPARSFLFDLGASTYREGSGGASQSWFVDIYAAKGIFFDRIFAWEAKPMNQSIIYETYPSNVLNNLSYFNIPASSTMDGKHNPLRIILQTCRPDDFVVLKLDIDAGIVENEFIDQIVTNPRLSSRIDELYYEHHAAMSPVHWWYWHGSVGENTLPQSYSNFTKLRELGIRAHSWV